jgi:hypothetical protein
MGEYNKEQRREQQEEKEKRHATEREEGKRASKTKIKIQREIERARTDTYVYLDVCKQRCRYARVLPVGHALLPGDAPVLGGDALANTQVRHDREQTQARDRREDRGRQSRRHSSEEDRGLD